ncbi:MAG: SDR family oxidoreductase [Rhizobiaceae bacterium]|nr:SDR family oxidoreductase [Rhizobiaceae bacterium]
MARFAQEFEGKVALVTGTSGIGRAAAIRLAQDGASVLACGIDEAYNSELGEIAEAGGLRIGVAQVDLSQDDGARQAVEQAVAAFGGLDIIVNAAAVHPYGTVTTTEPEIWARCMAVNIGSIYLTARHGIAHIERRGGGAIVNISSVQGHQCQPGVAAYVATKGAIHALTRAMALDHAKQNIRVNSVSPGSVRTPILELAARTFDGADADVDAVFKRFGAAHPLGRIGEPEEVAEMIAFLCSERAAFSTGGDYLVDGGLTAGIGVG